ncbi:MAG TPA: phosphate ABC transporter permease PstA [Acidimicrobiia bacterium]
MMVGAPERIDHFPSGDEFRRLLDRRTRRARAWHLAFLVLLMLAVLALATLLYTVINDSFGLVAVVNERNPEDVVAALGYDPATTELSDLSKDELVGLLQGSVATGAGRRLERERRFFDDRLVFESQAKWDEVCARTEPPQGCARSARSRADVLALVQERVVVGDVIVSRDLVPSLLDPGGFEAEVAQLFVDAPERFGDHTFDQVRFEWRAWLDLDFLRTPGNATPEIAGVRTAILGTAWLVVITLLFAVPIGVGAAVYLEEFARPGRFNDFIQTNITNLAGVPSIIYGMLGLAVLVRNLEPITSGAIFTSGPAPSDSGRTVLSAGITLGLLALPVVIISAQEALKAVPNTLRHAGLALGATRWQTVRAQVLPVAVPGILTGVILAVARAIGETAPLIVVGAAGFITADPTGPFSKYTALPIQIFQWTSFPQEEFRNIAAAAILVLLVMLLTLNATAVILRNRYSRRV